MKTHLLLPVLGLVILPLALADEIPNRLIDYPAFQKIVDTSRDQRESRRLSEGGFVEAMTRPGTVVLDARSAAMYKLLHVRGSVSLPFTDFTAASLSSVAPSKDTPILIYCNNNFLNSPVAFASKAPAASLNLATYTSLKAYGYENVYELGPLLDVKTTRIPFEGTSVGPK
jgi:hypothetical protein